MPHRHLLAKLLPPAYTPSAAHLAASLGAEGAELDRVLADSGIALGALTPFTYQQWVPDWERVYGLPGPCARPGQLLQERLALLALAFTERGGISIAWLKRYAALGGYDIEVQEFRPFRAGQSRAGDALTNEAWTFVLRIVATDNPPRVFRSGQSQAGDPLRLWGDSILECIINRYKPAHIVALFAYFTNGDPYAQN